MSEARPGPESYLMAIPTRAEIASLVDESAALIVRYDPHPRFDVACDLIERLSSALQALYAALQAAMLAAAPARVLSEEAWQPIATAPKDGTRVLGYVVHEPDDYSAERFERICLIEWLDAVDGPFGRVAGWQAEWIGSPTHWQPLPKPPALAVLSAGGK